MEVVESVYDTVAGGEPGRIRDGCMRIHHLDCGSMCPLGGRLIGGAGGPWAPAPMCCHCLLIEGEDGLILVDSGLGVEDVNRPERLGRPFRLAMRPGLEVGQTALRQVADRG